MTNDLTATSSDSLYTEAGARFPIELTGYNSWMMVGSQSCFGTANPDCVDVAITLSSALMADTPYEFALSTTSSGQ
jgi:hypothetical protein